MDKQDCQDSNKCCLNLVLCITCLTGTDNQIQNCTFKRNEGINCRMSPASFMENYGGLFHAFSSGNESSQQKIVLICNVFKFRNKSIIGYWGQAALLSLSYSRLYKTAVFQAVAVLCPERLHFYKSLLTLLWRWRVTLYLCVLMNCTICPAQLVAQRLKMTLPWSRKDATL